MGAAGKSRPRRADPARLARMRAAASLLHRPAGAGTAPDIARALCGTQAQDQRAGQLALRSRSARLRATDVDRARTEERSLLRTWAMRGTLHLIATDDVGWLLPLFEPAMVRDSSRRLAQLGMDAAAQERGLRELERALARGPMTRNDLAETLRRRGLELDPQTRLYLIGLATASGIACQGPDLGRRPSIVLAREWLGKRRAHDRDAALGELARRYLRAFGPATEADFSLWSGLGVTTIREALGRIGGELAEVRVAKAAMWALRGRARAPRGRIVRLLPAFDTYLMGHRDRRFIAADWQRVSPGGGILHPTIVVDGAAVGTWRWRRARETIEVEAELFAPLDADGLRQVEAEVTDIGRFEGAKASLVAA